jgi:hypothetical protein
MHVGGALLAVLVLGLVLSCRGGSKSSDPGARVTIGYFANLTHAQAVLGVASGDFERAVAPAKFETKLFNAGARAAGSSPSPTWPASASLPRSSATRRTSRRATTSRRS